MKVFHVLSEILETNEPALRIEIWSFGVIEIKPTKSKPKARNPRAGEIIIAPAHRKTHFKPGKHLSEILKRTLKTELSSASGNFKT
ncbi:MAG: HU family DNA-binding protein [Bacteroidota bacterium]